MNQQVDNPATSVSEESAIDTQKMKFRAYRNMLIDMLSLSVNTYPLPDIPVSTSMPVVQYNQNGTIMLSYSQPDVLYDVIYHNTKDQTIELATKDKKAIQGDDGAILIGTSLLTNEDYTFSVIAGKPAAGISSQLLQTVLVKTGIQTDLAIQVSNEPVAYGSRAVVLIKNAQSGTTYQLLGPGNSSLSDATDSGAGGDLYISTTQVLYEDVIVAVKATNNKTGQNGILGKQPTIHVTANMALQPVLETASADYGGTAYIILDGTQQSASYQVRFENIDEATTGNAKPKNTSLGDPVPGGGTIRLPVNNLTEDHTVNILVTKTQSRIEEQLPVLVLIPVKPDTGKDLFIVETTGSGATIRISDTQQGVMYQLVRETDNQHIGSPAYHHKNYGIDGSAGYPDRKAHIGYGFVVDEFTGDSVYLHTGPLLKITRFTVLAKKVTTWLETELVNNVPVRKRTWLEAKLLQTIEATPST